MDFPSNLRPMVSHKNIKKDIKIYWNKRLKIPLNKDNFKILDQLKNVDPKTDLFVILTEWEEFKEFNFKGIKILMVNLNNNSFYSIGK